MALTAFTLPISALLLSLAVFACADGYGQDGNGFGYGPKPEAEKTNTHDNGYGPKPEGEKPNSHDNGYGNGYSPKPEAEKPTSQDKLFPTTVGIQGLIYCRSGPKLIPLKGAMARITCLAVDENGYESAPFSVLSQAANEEGYFLATLSSSELEDAWKLTECKAFLDSSPVDDCNVPTDVNKGLTGALLSSFTVLTHSHMQLYSVGPFFFTRDSKPAPNGY